MYLGALLAQVADGAGALARRGHRLRFGFDRCTECDRQHLVGVQCARPQDLQRKLMGLDGNVRRLLVVPRGQQSAADPRQGDKRFGCIPFLRSVLIGEPLRAGEIGLPDQTANVLHDGRLCGGKRRGESQQSEDCKPLLHVSSEAT